MRSKNTTDTDKTLPLLPPVSFSTSQLRPYHSRIVRGSPLPTGEGPNETGGHFHQHLLSTYYAPGFQNESPTFPTPSPTCPSYSIYQPLLALKTRPPTAKPGIDLSQKSPPAYPICQNSAQPLGFGSKVTSWASSAPFLCVLNHPPTLRHNCS